VPSQRIDRAILEVALKALEAKRASLQQQIEHLQGMFRGGESNTKTARSRSTAPRAGPKRVLSPETRQRIADAQKKRWAAARKKSKGSKK
jgi:hypothetical protein